eukprot:363934-Chlamydomonas_euryale.AAC.4
MHRAERQASCEACCGCMRVNFPAASTVKHVRIVSIGRLGAAVEEWKGRERSSGGAQVQSGAGWEHFSGGVHGWGSVE